MQEVPVFLGINVIAAHVGEGRSLIAYGSYGLSPLNGGRDNGIAYKGMEDPLGRFDSDEYRHTIYDELFFDDLNNLNRKGIPFYLTFTNLICNPVELMHKYTDRILSRLASYDCNGVVVANPGLERFVRGVYPSLKIISSCIRVFSTETKLDEQDRIDFYNRSLQQDYELVTLAPLDSRKPELVDKIDAGCRDRLVAIVNAPCVEPCNPYWEYMQVSLINKRESYYPIDGLDSEIERIARRRDEQCGGCDKSRELVLDGGIIADLIDLGIKTFKIARSDFLNNQEVITYVFNCAKDTMEVEF